MKEQLFCVSMRHIKTNEKIDLEVWAANVDAATSKLNVLFRYGGEYRWTGSGPVYGDDNQVITREPIDY